MDTDEFAGSKAQALLDAHVAYLAARLQGPALQFELERRVDWVLADAARLRLGDVISEASIKQTAIDYAAHMRLGGGIPALVGDIAAAVYEGHRYARELGEEPINEIGFRRELTELAADWELRG